MQRTCTVVFLFGNIKKLWKTLDNFFFVWYNTVLVWDIYALA